MSKYLILKSLCPRTYYGTKIDAAQYTDMSMALFQLLYQDDTVPEDCIDVCNIVKPQASDTNGYTALHDIMERIHPL